MKTAMQKLGESSATLDTRVTAAIRGKDLSTVNLGKALLDFAAQATNVISQLQAEVQTLQKELKK